MSNYDYDHSLSLYADYCIGKKIPDRDYSLIRFGAMGMDMRKVGEPIISKILNYEDAPHIHGADSYNPIRKKLVEIKCETQLPLSGKASWGSTKTLEKLHKLKKEDQEYIQAGFEKKGRLVYIIQKDLNDTDIPSKLLERIEAGSTTPKTGHKQIGDEFKVLYLNQRYLDNTPISGPFKKKLIANYG